MGSFPLKPALICFVLFCMQTRHEQHIQYNTFINVLSFRIYSIELQLLANTFA